MKNIANNIKQTIQTINQKIAQLTNNIKQEQKTCASIQNQQKQKQTELNDNHNKLRETQTSKTKL